MTCTAMCVTTLNPYNQIPMMTTYLPATSRVARQATHAHALAHGGRHELCSMPGHTCPMHVGSGKTGQAWNPSSPVSSYTRPRCSYSLGEPSCTPRVLLPPPQTP